jgi:hypothetical protein
MEKVVKRQRSRQRAKDSLELIEEAIHLLRLAPLSHLTVYYSGTLPFVLAALYFWGDMSRSPFAGQHLIAGALTLACLFLWMKTCQAVFSRQMRCLVSGESPVLSPAHLLRIFLTQAALQPTELFFLPLALIPAFPFAWVFAFYQNLGVLDDGETLDVRRLIKKASSQALLWPLENHFTLAIMTAFGLFLCLNLMTACFVLPGLVKMLFGIETVFTRSGLALLNTTFMAATFGLAYLCIDPILKTIYALRCFYGESQRSGADLKAELRQVATARSIAVLLSLVILLFGLGRTNLFADEQPQSNPTASAAPVPLDQRAVASSSMPAAELDRTIQQVIQQPKYAWREPRKKIVEEGNQEKGFFRRIWERVKPFLITCLKTIGGWVDRFFRWLFGRQRTQSSDAAYRLSVLLHVLLYTLIAAAAAGLIWLLYTVWKSQRQQPGTITSEPLQPMPDLSDENLEADQFPEESWMKLARKLLANGELRVALRAFYLASLAQLAGKNLIQLARFKSNRDYERELRRRAHALPGLLAAFGENLSVFDRIWYGMYEINPDMVNQFAENVERMRTAGATSLPTPGAA